jgi:flagellar protein FlaI
MRDPHIEDISCDGYDLPIFVYHDEYTDIETNVSFSQAELDNFVVRLAQHSGRHISVGDPMVETTLPDGSRAELALGEEVTPRGSAFTIRKYADEPFTPVDLLEYGTFNIDQMAYLWLAIENNRSLIFAGGTASGKTTSMNAISMFIPPRSKVLTIEDTRELALYHDNWLSSVTRDRMSQGSDITMYDLLRSALRHRPEYIVVGEVRGEEAITLFQAMNTGHTTYSTMHADSVRTVINRLENEPINVPRAMVQSLDILCVQTLTRFEGERVRRNKTVAEIEGIDQRTGELDYSNAFSWNADDDSFSREDSEVLDDIRDDNGWTRSELLRELQRRRDFLRYLWDNDVTDYRRFTAMINEYYADPDAAMASIDDGDDEAELTTTN